MEMIKKILIIMMFLILGTFVKEDTLAATGKFQIRLSVIDPTIINIEEYDIDFQEILGEKISEKEDIEQKFFLKGKDGSEVEVVLSQGKEDSSGEELVSTKERNPRSNDLMLIASKENNLKKNLVELDRDLKVTMNYR